jgi:hypothetical protein
MQSQSAPPDKEGGQAQEGTVCLRGGVPKTQAFAGVCGHRDGQS